MCLIIPWEPQGHQALWGGRSCWILGAPPRWSSGVGERGRYRPLLSRASCSVGPGHIHLREHLLSPGSQLRAWGPTAWGLPGDLSWVLAWPGMALRGLHLLEQQLWGPRLSEASRPWKRINRNSVEDQGIFFPGHKQKQGRSGPFSRDLPGGWEHGGARQASPTCPARQLARTPAPPLGSKLQSVLNGHGSAQQPVGCCSQLFGRSNMGP